MVDASHLPRILIVEDDEPMRRHLEGAVDGHRSLERIGSFGNVTDALAFLEATPPDVLVTDLGLPDGSGLEIIRALRKRAPEALALVVTVMGDEKSVIEAIQNGARGYLLKDEPVDAIGTSITSLLEGGSPISPAIARYLLTRVQADPTTEDGEAEPEKPSLSEREYEVLKLVAKGFRYPEIANFLDISTHTVTTYVRRIYGKLEVSSRGEAVYEAVNLGLLKLDE